MGAPKRTLSTGELSAFEGCFDCTIARAQRHQLCWQHWLEFIHWWSDAHKTPAFRRLPPAERDRAVREWVNGQAGAVEN
jgi:hypothetical protein